MLPEVGALEYLIIAIVALIVVGPKDLPVLLRKLGQFVAKLRGMAGEFRASFDEMARQSELDDLRKEVDAMRRGQFADMADHDHQMRQTVNEIEQSLSDVGVQLHPPMSYQYDPPATPALEISEIPQPKALRAPRKKAIAAEPAQIVAVPKPRKPRTTKVVGDAA